MTTKLSDEEHPSAEEDGGSKIYILY